MITLTFTVPSHSLNVHIEAWYCGAMVADVHRLANPESDPKTYFDTPEVLATMQELAEPVIETLRKELCK